ncbi:MAG: Uma2 family endonuclease [Cyanobacteria bacterium P01_F01_bin.150]
MTSLVIKSERHSLMVDVSSIIPKQMTHEQFYAFCLANQDLRIERSADGDVIVMPPAFSDTGNRNGKIFQQVANWADKDGTGETFDSSSGFTLPNGALRSPDVSWITLQRWNALSSEDQSSFALICPDFVVELRSASDTLRSVQAKLDEYIENGARLGLLIDRKQRTVHIYRPGTAPEILQHPDQVDCGPELPGLVFKMARIW